MAKNGTHFNLGSFQMEYIVFLFSHLTNYQRISFCLTILIYDISYDHCECDYFKEREMGG